MASKRCYYEVLGIEPGADETIIRAAYRELAKTYHPDRNNGNPEAESKFKEASEAYEVLRDPEKRRVYDRYGHAGLESRGAVPDFQGSPFFDILNALGLGDLLGGRRGQSSEGADLQVQISVTLEEAYRGGEKSVTLTLPVKCPACSGSGMQANSNRTMCVRCAGAGAIARGFLGFASECPNCEGRGYRITNPCRDCQGGGTVPSEQVLTVPIPPGVHNGFQGRLTGTEFGGDLYIVFKVERHARFVRDDHDLHVQVDVSFTQAALGATIEVPTPDGEGHSLELPPGSQSGEEIRLAGLGMPVMARSSRRQSHSRGDLVVHLQVVTPRHLTKRQKELLRELEQSES
jgi:molecular chaperone DnaJ